MPFFKRIAFLTSVLMATGCSSGAPTAPTAADPVASYLPAPPPAYVGFNPPDYQGSWRGTWAVGDCRTNLAGFCRNFFGAGGSFHYDFVQQGITVTGTFGVGAFSGYVTSDLGLFGVYGPSESSAVSSGGFLLRMTESGLTGISVQDTFHDSVRIRSRLTNVSNLRRE